jgi:hypothetical protein
VAALAVLALILGLFAAGGPARAEDDVYVQQDGTPIVSKPGIGGKILAWVDAGFPLTVHGRDGEWLQVSSSVLRLPTDSLWVPAARVGRRAPGAYDIAYAPDGPPMGVGKHFFRLEVVGGEDVRVRAHCRIDAGPDRKDRFHTVIEEIPLVLDVYGDAVDCTVAMLVSFGWIDVVLLTSDGTVIASAETSDRRGRVRLRSEGPWGSAAGFALPARFVILKDQPKIDVPGGRLVPPLGNPVPPLANPVPPMAAPVPPP